MAFEKKFLSENQNYLLFNEFTYFRFNLIRFTTLPEKNKQIVDVNKNIVSKMKKNTVLLYLFKGFPFLIRFDFFRT